MAAQSVTKTVLKDKVEFFYQFDSWDFSFAT